MIFDSELSCPSLSYRCSLWRVITATVGDTPYGSKGSTIVCVWKYCIRDTYDHVGRPSKIQNWQWRYDVYIPTICGLIEWPTANRQQQMILVFGHFARALVALPAVLGGRARISTRHDTASRWCNNSLSQSSILWYHSTFPFLFLSVPIVPPSSSSCQHRHHHHRLRCHEK